MQEAQGIGLGIAVTDIELISESSTGLWQTLKHEWEAHLHWEAFFFGMVAGVCWLFF